METSKQKPDLMAGAATTHRPLPDKRILAHLEHGPKAPRQTASASGWTIDGWTIGLCALLLLMCSVAWLLHDRTVTPATLRRSAGSDAATQVATRHAAPAQPVTETPQVAAIVNVAAAEHVLLESETPTAATVAIANAASAAPPAATQPQSTRAVAAAHKPAAPALRVPAAPVSADTDVTLLAALVAHAAKPTAVAPERSRDIIERQDGDSTAQLLARCKQLGVIEGMLCRSRICSGRWEADAACRAPSH